MRYERSFSFSTSIVPCWNQRRRIYDCDLYARTSLHITLCNRWHVTDVDVMSKYIEKWIVWPRNGIRYTLLENWLIKIKKIQWRWMKMQWKNKNETELIVWWIVNGRVNSLMNCQWKSQYFDELLMEGSIFWWIINWYNDWELKREEKPNVLVFMTLKYFRDELINCFCILRDLSLSKQISSSKKEDFSSVAHSGRHVPLFKEKFSHIARDKRNALSLVLESY